MTLLKIWLRFAVLIATNLEGTKSIFFIILSLTIIILILSRSRQFFIGLNLFALQLVDLNFCWWSLGCCFLRKIRFLFFFWLIFYFLTNPSDSKRSEFLMYLNLFFMTVTVILGPLFYYPVIWLTWTWTVHILSTDSWYGQFFSRWWFLLIYFCDGFFNLGFFHFHTSFGFRFFSDDWCWIPLIVEYSLQSFYQLIAQFQIFRFKFAKLWITF